VNLTHADLQGAAVLAGLLLVATGLGLLAWQLAVVAVGAVLIWFGRRTP
jgi:hypothetical protein